MCVHVYILDHVHKHKTAPDLPSLCLTGLPASLQLLVKMDKPPSCCHTELINRTRGNKRRLKEV